MSPNCLNFRGFFFCNDTQYLPYGILQYTTIHDTCQEIFLKHRHIEKVFLIGEKKFARSYVTRSYVGILQKIFALIPCGFFKIGIYMIKFNKGDETISYNKGLFLKYLP